jgi:hypothetical protein
MPLLAYRIGLREPGTKLRIDFIGRGQSEKVYMIPRRNCLDPVKTRMFETSREYQMTIQPVCARCYLGKRHPGLESDPGFLWKNSDWAVRSQRGRNLVEERSDLRPLALEVMLQIMTPAGVGLIAIGEVAPALLAVPESWSIHDK